MQLIAVANITNGKDTIGLRILDLDTRQVKDVPLDNVKSVISRGIATIDNIGITNNKVVGTNGAINRLPKIFNGNLVEKSPLIIVNQLGDEGYTVADYKGTVIKMKAEVALRYAKSDGIANGKVVQKDGKSFISSISGNYKVIEMAEASSDKIKQMEAKLTLLKNSPIKFKERLGDLLVFYYGDELLAVSLHKQPIIQCKSIKEFERGYYIFGDGKKHGILDSRGKKIVEPEYIEITMASENIFIVKDKGYYGYIDSNGTEITEIKYNEAYPFADGLARVLKNGYMFINMQGREVLGREYVYTDAYDFCGGISSMRRKGGIWDVYNSKGDRLGGYENTTKPYNGVIGVITGGEKFYINKGGGSITPRYDAIGEFYCGLAKVKLRDRLGYIDSKGNEVIQIKYRVAEDFNDGLAMVNYKGKYGYIDTQGKEIIKTEYSRIGAIRDGVIRVEKISGNSKFGFINSNGVEIAPLKYIEADEFNDGKALVSEDKKNYVYIDKAGNIIPNSTIAYRDNNEYTIKQSLEKSFGILYNELSKIGFSKMTGKKYSTGNGMHLEKELEYKGNKVKVLLGYLGSGWKDTSGYENLFIKVEVNQIGKFEGRDNFTDVDLSGKLFHEMESLSKSKDYNMFYQSITESVSRLDPKIKNRIDLGLINLMNESYMLNKGAKVSRHITTVASKVSIESRERADCMLELEGNDGRKFSIRYNPHNGTPLGWDYRYEIREQDGSKYGVPIVTYNSLDTESIGGLVSYVEYGVAMAGNMINYFKLGIDYIENKYYTK